MRWIDIPPVWLLLALAAAWGLGRLAPGVGFGGWAEPAGGALVILGLLLMLAAVLTMTRARTTVIPHEQPSALVTEGVFRLSRNPIYLGDALVLTGFILYRDAVLALPVIALFVRVIERRFIRPEEERLRAGFGAAFEAWAARTRRWL